MHSLTPRDKLAAELEDIMVLNKQEHKVDEVVEDTVYSGSNFCHAGQLETPTIALVPLVAAGDPWH